MDIKKYGLDPETETLIKMAYISDYAGMKYDINDEDMLNNSDKMMNQEV